MNRENLSRMVQDRIANGKRLMSQPDLAAIGAGLVRQLEQGRTSNHLRLSQSGACTRRLVYQAKHYERSGHGIDAASIMNFAMGDTTEVMLVIALAEVLRKNKMGRLLNVLNNQIEVNLELEIDEQRTAHIPGHPDGIIELIDDNGEPYRSLLEIKSMSDYGYKKFWKEGLPKYDMYYSQIQAYMHCLGLKQAYVLAYGKNTGSKDALIREGDTEIRQMPAIHGIWVDYDPDAVWQIKERFLTAILAGHPDDVPRPYQPDTAKKTAGRLRFPCDWCPYWRHCWPNAKERAVETGWFSKYQKIHVYVEGE